MSTDDNNATRILGGDEARTVIADAALGRPATSTVKRFAHNALSEGTRLAEFEILGLIGEGGFGIVYLAHDTSLGRQVALKEYMPSALAARAVSGDVSIKSARHTDTFELGLRSFMNEARLLARFDHPSLLKVYRFWEDKGTAYMAMPFYEGATLKDTLAAMEQPPDEDWLRGLLAPLLEALNVIHEEQCFHRDIAPDNILLLKDSGRPLLLDFGAARRVIGGATQDLTVILKPGYAPVEQYAEAPSFKQGAWTDLYALAAVVHFAMRGTTPPEAVGRMLKDSYVPLADQFGERYGRVFLQAIDRALAVNPEQRPQNVATFAAELGVAVGTGPVEHAPPPRSAPRADRPARARTGLLMGIAAVVVAVLVAVWLWLDGETSPPVSPMVAGGMEESADASVSTRDPVPIQPPAVVEPPARIQGPELAQPQPSVPAPTPAPVSPPEPSHTPAQSQAATPAQTSSTVSIPAPTPSGSPATSATATLFDTLARLPALGDPMIDVRVDNERSVARIGRDSLRFTIHSNVSGYLYVFTLSPDNQYIRLFPNGIDDHNRIQAGRALRLPRDSWPMDAGEPAGVNRFLVLVSRHPRKFHDGTMPAGGVFEEFPYALDIVKQYGREAGARLAGYAQCAASAPDCDRAWAAATFDISVTP